MPPKTAAPKIAPRVIARKATLYAGRLRPRQKNDPRGTASPSDPFYVMPDEAMNWTPHRADAWPFANVYAARGWIRAAGYDLDGVVITPAEEEEAPRPAAPIPAPEPDRTGRAVKKAAREARAAKAQAQAPEPITAEQHTARAVEGYEAQQVREDKARREAKARAESEEIRAEVIERITPEAPAPTADPGDTGDARIARINRHRAEAPAPDPEAPDESRLTDDQRNALAKIRHRVANDDGTYHTAKSVGTRAATMKALAARGFIVRSGPHTQQAGELEYTLARTLKEQEARIHRAIEQAQADTAPGGKHAPAPALPRGPIPLENFDAVCARAQEEARAIEAQAPEPEAPKKAPKLTDEQQTALTRMQRRYNSTDRPDEESSAQELSVKRATLVALAKKGVITGPLSYAMDRKPNDHRFKYHPTPEEREDFEARAARVLAEIRRPRPQPADLVAGPDAQPGAAFGALGVNAQAEAPIIPDLETKLEQESDADAQAQEEDDDPGADLAQAVTEACPARHFTLDEILPPEEDDPDALYWHLVESRFNTIFDTVEAEDEEEAMRTAKAKHPRRKFKLVASTDNDRSPEERRAIIAESARILAQEQAPEEETQETPQTCRPEEETQETEAPARTPRPSPTRRAMQDRPATDARPAWMDPQTTTTPRPRRSTSSA